MSIEQIKEVRWKIFNQANMPSVSFPRGDPTLLPELPELIRYVKALDMRVNLRPDGTRITHELAQE